MEPPQQDPATYSTDSGKDAQCVSRSRGGVAYFLLIRRTVPYREGSSIARKACQCSNVHSSLQIHSLRGGAAYIHTCQWNLAAATGNGCLDLCSTVSTVTSDATAEGLSKTLVADTDTDVCVDVGDVPCEFGFCEWGIRTYACSPLESHGRLSQGSRPHSK